MRILHISPSYKPAYHYGGPTVSVSRLAEEQAKTGAEVLVMTTTANGAGELEVPTGVPQMIDGVSVRYFRRWTGDHGHFSPGLLRALWRAARNVDVVHIHSWWNWVALGAVLVCRIRGARTVISPRGMLSPYTLQRRTRRLFQQTIGRWLTTGALLHATSDQEAKEFRDLELNAPFFIEPNIVALPQAGYPGTDALERPLHILFLSRIDPKKGLDILLEALSGLSISWQMTIAGQAEPSYQKKLLEQINRLGLNDHITWAGWVSGPEKWQLLASADVIALPSLNENFANVVPEALALGTPVLLSNLVGLSSYVRMRDFGWITPPEAPAIRQALQQISAAPEKRERIRRVAPEQVRADFDPTILSSRYLRHYAAFAENRMYTPFYQKINAGFD